MIAFLTKLVGERVAKWAVFIAGLLILIGLLIILARCNDDDGAVEAQAQQTTISGDAIANAAQDAVATITNRTAVESSVDRAAVQTTKDIDHADTIDDVRGAVLGGVCGQAAHRNDPACAVR